MTVVIYGTSRSRAFRSLWAATELGIDFEHEPISWQTCATDPSYRALNPAGTIPCLLDDDFMLSESLAINLYLARKVDRLWPSGEHAQAKALQWSFWALSSLEVAYIEWANHSFWLPQALRKPEVAASAMSQLARPLQLLEDHLQSTDWLVDDKWSIADLNVASMISLLKGRVGATRPLLDGWLNRCTGRASFAAAAARP